MNFLRFKYILAAFFALLFFSRTVPAQPSLPPLPQDKAIQKGTLGCGVSYYMVTNPQVKGYADIAVVQRDEPLSAAKRGGLESAFLSRMGIAPGPEGFLADVDGSTVYRFSRIPFYRKEVLDSTLLYTFTQVAASKAQQAVIVCGDIDAVELKKKMDIFSMMVPRMLVKENHHPDYVWEPSPAPFVLFHPEGEDAVSVSYTGSRIPFAYMNTAQALVSGIFAGNLDILVRHRLERNFRDAGLSHGPIRFQVLSSADYGADERYTVTVSVEKDQQDAAMRIISSTLAEMDSFGVKEKEYVQAKQVLAPRYYRQAGSTPSTEDYVKRCVANFLYGANLAPYSEALRLFALKRMADSTETRLFNSFSGALLEQLSNLTLEYTGVPDSLEKKDDALFYYNLAYLYGSISDSGKDYSWHSADTAGLDRNCPRVKVRSEKAEAVTGGTLLTFSNGMRVIFKQVKGSGMFSYALLLSGGLAQVKDLREGEGGYIPEMLSLYDVGGIPAADFRDILSANGIKMDFQADLNSLILRGDAPSDRLTLVMKSLLSIAQDRSPNVAAFQAYSRNQMLEGQEITDKLHGLLTPGYAYSARKNPAVLDAETRAKAEAFFEDRFARANDGILILSGDLSDEGVRRVLSRYLGGFRTMRGTAPRRNVEMKSLSGTATYTEEGGTPGLYILADTDYTLTAEHFYTAQVAADALLRTLTASLVPYGFAPEVSVEFLSHPEERVRYLVTCHPLKEESLPADVTEVSAQSALRAVRTAFKTAAETPVKAVDLEAWKQKLLSRTRDVMAAPEGFTTTLVARYASNKDITSRYQESIGAISADKVQSLLRYVATGGRIEYIVP